MAVQGRHILFLNSIYTPFIRVLTMVLVFKHLIHCVTKLCRFLKRMNSSRTETSQADTSATAEVFPICAQVQKPRGYDQSATNCSESSTTYATVQPTRKTNNRSPTAQHIVYAELDLQPKAQDQIEMIADHFVTLNVDYFI